MNRIIHFSRGAYGFLVRGYYMLEFLSAVALQVFMRVLRLFFDEQVANETPLL